MRRELAAEAAEETALVWAAARALRPETIITEAFMLTVLKGLCVVWWFKKIGSK